MVAAGDAVPSAGEPAVFCRPVVTAPAAPRRDGSVLADGWLPDFVRLGELERHFGGGVIENVVAAAPAQGRLKRRQRRRLMSYPLAVRLMIVMTLMPDASGLGVLRRGQLVRGPGRWAGTVGWPQRRRPVARETSAACRARSRMPHWPALGQAGAAGSNRWQRCRRDVVGSFDRQARTGLVRHGDGHGGEGGSALATVCFGGAAA
jgi:hypothetical protein